MQVDLFVAVTCLYFLLTSFKPVRSITVTKTGNTNSVIILENDPFTLQCTATDNKEISGKFRWERENIRVQPVTQVPVEEKNVIINETRAEDKRSVTSILTVKKTPPYFGVAFYYACLFGQENQKSFAVLIIPAGTIPNITIVNGTNSFVRSIEAKYAEAVELICHLSYKVTELIARTEFFMSWKKENGKIFRNRIKVSLKKSSKNLETFLFKYTVVVDSYHHGGTYLCQLDGTVASSYSVNLTESVELKIKPRINGDTKKEIVKNAGEDVKLQCDIVAYPIQYEWQYIDGMKITDSRYKIKGGTLAIDDITYDDRKKYICIGNYNNGTEILKQTITLRVKDPLAPLWPFIGILVEAIVVAVIIGGSEFYRSKRKTETDGGNKIINDEPASTTYT